jgi:hypothetical protein
LRKFLRGKRSKKMARRMKDSERIKHLVELAKPFKNDQTETGKLARTILAGHRMFVRLEKKLKVAEKEYKILKTRKGVKK